MPSSVSSAPSAMKSRGRVLSPLLARRMRGAAPRTFRSMLEFAESDIRIVEGPRKGLPFSADFMPFDRLLLAEYDNPRWTDFILAGSVQSGKTLRGYVIPTLYFLFERGENVINGVPNVDLAQDIYDEKVRPVIEKSTHRDKIPTRGKGSRGGRFIYARMANGAVLRFASAGGKDSSRIGRTARIVCVTEADQCALERKASLEATPIKQFKGRSVSYGERARFFAECVVHSRKDWIWDAVTKTGSDGKVWIRCPHCGVWQYPERANLRGWQDAEDSIAARARTFYACPACAVAWTDADRLAACASPRIVHRGQTVNVKGEVEGELPPTRVFALRWNCMHSPFITLGDIGVQEWQAAQSAKPEDEQELCQFWWAEPYVESIEESNILTANAVRSQVNGYARGVIPEASTAMPLYIDVMLRYAYWTFSAWAPGCLGWIPDYGVEDIIQGQRGEDEAIVAALLTFGERVLIPGWPKAVPPQQKPLVAADGSPLQDSASSAVEAPLVQPSIVGIDARWKPDAVFEACRQINAKANRLLCWPCMGDGTAPGQGRFYLPKAADDVRVVRPHWYQKFDHIRRMWLTHLDADHWKNHAQSLFLAQPGSPGSVTLFGRAVDGQPLSPMTHNSFAQHQVSEKRVSEYVAGKGLVSRFAREGRKANHWLDSFAGCCALADIQGITLTPAPAGRSRSWSERRTRQGGIHGDRA